MQNKKYANQYNMTVVMKIIIRYLTDLKSNSTEMYEVINKL